MAEDWETGWSDFFESDDTPDVADLLWGLHDNSVMDQHAHVLAVDAALNDNDAAFSELWRYMWNEYGIDINDAWDWQDFKAWYDSQ